MGVAMRHGRVVIESVESKVLEGNAPGDPHVRRVPVYLPPSYDGSPERRYPVVYVLTGFMGRGRMLLNDGAWSPSLDDRMDALIDRGCPEMILVMPDCLTRFGGSQYLNSTATGRYQDHLVRELVPWVDGRYRTLASRDHRGVAGKSSGGFGALTLGLKYADAFGAIACHSGDVAFDYCYRPELPKSCAAIQRAGGLEAWVQAFDAAIQKRSDDLHVLDMVAMAACYSPNPAAPLGIDFPIDLSSGRWREDVWRRWLEHDPLHLVERHYEALRSLRLVYVDCGARDEFNLQLGARLLVERLIQFRVEHEYQEYDDGHMNVSYRYGVSLPKLGRALSQAPATA
jgi:S-formylglutathione hydrolase FrmB